MPDRASMVAAPSRGHRPVGRAVADAGPSRICPGCYAINPWRTTACGRCGSTLRTSRNFDAGLVWALGHPDTETAMLAARLLGERQHVGAIEPLGRLARRRNDPYRAAAAVRALQALAGHPEADALVAEARSHPSVIVRRAAGANRSGAEAVAAVAGATPRA